MDFLNDHITINKKNKQQIINNKRKENKMKKNFERRSLTGMEIFVLIIMAYALLTFIMRLWSPVMPEWFIVQRQPMNQSTYWRNLLQIPIYVFDIIFIIILICFFGAITVLVPVVVAMIFWSFIRAFYNLFAHILPIPYCEFDLEKLTDILFSNTALIIYTVLCIITGFTQFLTVFVSQF